MPKGDLRAELGGDPPSGLLAHVDDDGLERLTAAVRAAKASQRAALDQAERNALSPLPRIVRKTLRTMLR